MPPFSIYKIYNFMKKEEAIEQPEYRYQQELDKIMDNTPSECVFMGKKVKIGWLHNGTMRKITHVNMTETDDVKRNTKVCVLILLNNIWKIRLLYWIYWRWLYYIRDVDMKDVLSVVDASKKKIPSGAYLITTTLVTEMNDLMMTMTKKERNAIQAEQTGEQPSV